MKRAIVSVINDLSTDQRVHRTCTVLHALGFEVLLVGRRQRKSMPMDVRHYRTKRMKLIFEKGFLFYAFYNLRLFFFLLFHRADVLVANDLDTLWPNHLIAKLKGSKLVYDTHEIFCEVPELQQSKWKKNFWKRIERRIFPKLKYVFTVNKSIADIYSKEYHVPVHVVRNIPGITPVQQTFKLQADVHPEGHPHTMQTGGAELSKEIIRIQKKGRGIPVDKKMIILQGSGINIHRGSEEAVLAMKYVEGAVLFIVGSGDVIDILKEMVKKENLSEKVMFVNKLPYAELIRYTRLADIGLTLDKDTNINYRYSLPNKIFDYIHAGIAVLASPLVEVKRVVDEYKVGAVIDSHDPQHIAGKINYMLDDVRLAEWKQNAKLASLELTWEKEKRVLEEVFKTFL